MFQISSNIYFVRYDTDIIIINIIFLDRFFNNFKMDRFDHLSKLQNKMQSQRYAEPGNESRVEQSCVSSELSRENHPGEQGAQGQELS